MADQAKVPHVQQFASEWGKFVATQVSHLDSFLGELARIEAAGVAQLIGSWEDAGRYAKESLVQAERVSAEWRKLALETARRAAQTVSPPQPA